MDAATQAAGLAVTGADVSPVGVGGATLGGGLGWLHRMHGLSGDNLLAAEIVTADAEVLRVSAQEHPELFWALRGGGGTFGAVTAFTFALHPVGPVHAGTVICPMERAADALALYQHLCESGDELFLRAMLVTAPSAPFIPEQLRRYRNAVASGLTRATAPPSRPGQHVPVQPEHPPSGRRPSPPSPAAARPCSSAGAGRPRT